MTPTQERSARRKRSKTRLKRREAVRASEPTFEGVQGAILALMNARCAAGLGYTPRGEIYALVFSMGKQRLSNKRHRARRAGFANSILRSLCDEQIIHAGPTGYLYYLGAKPHTSESSQRAVSMIYELPTNDIPVNRIAASVIGPVWGSSGLL
jgi:hypothetical protein